MKNHLLTASLLLSLSLAACCTMHAQTATLTGPRKFAVMAIANPRSLAADAAGNLYIGDARDGSIHKLTPDGRASVIGGAGATLSDPLGLGVARDGSVFVANASGGGVFRIRPGGSATAIAKPPADQLLSTPIGVAIDSAGNAFVANNGDNTVMKITPSGEVSVFAGKTGTAGSADGTGTVYVADTDSSVIRKITPNGTVTTLAGKAGDAAHADGPASAARFSEPRGIAVDSAGNVFVADTGNACIRQITPGGMVSTIAAAEPVTATKP